MIHKRTLMVKVVRRVMLAVVALALVAACSNVSSYKIASPPSQRALPHVSVISPSVTITAKWINGVVLGGMGELQSWESETGERPAVIAMFVRFGAPFPTWAVREVLMAKAVPLLQLDPFGISLAAIARGSYNRQLRDYSSAIRSLHDPVILSFGHEMNGFWYSWGCGNASPSEFRKAWRHIHAMITAPQVSWMWTINDIWSGDQCLLRPWYPGAAYVNWIGIDGYLRQTAYTFSSAFGRTLVVLHRFVRHKPIFLAETGVSLGPDWAKRLNSLYSGAHRAGFRGILYFDGETSNGDYRPQDLSAALAAFRAVLRKWS
jgi:mannan endo-1,4-beta-mannosidase